MTICLLIRHAAYDFGQDHLAGRSEHPLSACGELEALALAKSISANHSTRLQSSPRRRCRQTIEPIVTKTGQTVELCPPLDEIDFGDWTGRSFIALHDDPLWRRWNDQRSATRPPGGETMREAQSRIVAHLISSATAHPSATIVMVTHAELIRSVVLHSLRLPLEAWHSIDVPYTSITTVAVGRSGQLMLDQKVAA